jgi:hypothetical protein
MASFLRCILLSILAYVTAIFFILGHKRPEFRKTLLNIKCVLIFSEIWSEKYLIIEKIQRGIIIHVHSAWNNVPVILVKL